MSEYVYQLSVRFLAESADDALQESRRLSTLVFEDESVVEVEGFLPEEEAAA